MSVRVAKSAEEEKDDLPEIQTVMRTARSISVSDIEDPFAKAVGDIVGITPAIKRRGTRVMNKVLEGKDGTPSKRVDLKATGYSLFGVITPPYNLDYLAALYEKSDAHAAACNAKAYNIVGLGYDFIESDAIGTALDRAADDEDKLNSIRRRLARGKIQLQDWLDSCNKEDEFSETLIKVWIDYETTGNGYLEIGRTTQGDIRYIGHIPATTMRVRKDRDGFVQIASDSSAAFFRNFGDQKTSDPITGSSRPNEVLHIKKYTPTNSYYGVPNIISALNAVTGNEFAARFNLDYFENKAVPRYVVIIKGATLSKRSETELMEFFETSLRGANHRTILIPLPPDTDNQKVEFKMEAVEANVQEGSFENYTKANRTSILMAHRVPITKVTASDNAALAAARDADKTFKESVTRPEQRIFEKKLNGIVSEQTDVFKLKLNELSLTDEDTQSQIDNIYLNTGVTTPNEVRSRQGKGGIKSGDEPVSVMAQLQLQADVQREGQQLTAKTAKESLAAKPASTPAASDAKTTSNATRTRDTTRASQATDRKGEGRNSKGDGRKTP